MKRGVRVATLGLVLLTVAAATAASGQDKPETVAQKESDSWLAIVDAGKYGESWDASAQVFKSAMARDKWIDALKQVREPLGNVASRKLKGTQYQKNPPNGPPGEYVAVQYNTDFANMKSTLETVALILESDGKWRVTGYLIKPAE